MAVFLDTGAFMAYRNEKDAHHEKADGIVRGALKGKFRKIYTSDFVYDEAMTLALVRTGRKEVALDISEVILSPRIDMVFVDDLVLKDAQELFFRYFDRGVSFTDATTMALMEDLGIRDIITFDAHFKDVYNVLAP